MRVCCAVDQPESRPCNGARRVHRCSSATPGQSYGRRVCAIDAEPCEWSETGGSPRDGVAARQENNPVRRQKNLATPTACVRAPREEARSTSHLCCGCIK